MGRNGGVTGDGMDSPLLIWAETEWVFLFLDSNNALLLLGKGSTAFPAGRGESPVPHLQDSGSHRHIFKGKSKSGHHLL